MAQPHAGAGYGFHFPLRAGVEVMLTCIEGDPDRPIITGAVPNPTTPTTVSSNNGTRNVIRTGSGVEMNIDDTDGSTRFKLTVPYANSVLQLGAPNQPTPGFHVGTDQQALVETGTSIALTAGTKIDINANGGDLTEAASAGVSITAKGGQLNLDGSAGVFIEGHPTVYAHAADLDATFDASATVTSPLTKAEGTAMLDLAGGIIVHTHGGAMVYEHAPMVIIKGDGVVSIVSPGMVTINAPAINVTGGSTVDVSAPTVNVTGGTTATVSAPTVNVTGSGAVNIGTGVVSVTGSLVKLNT
jgi:Type VI secretion system/phage-baseplate injector OB domain